MSAGQERTEEATPRRRARAASQGTAARSPAASAACAVALAAVPSVVATHSAQRFLHALAVAAHQATLIANEPSQLLRAAGAILIASPGSLIVIAAATASLAAALVGAAACGSLHIATAALTPRWTRLSPSASARRLVSVEGAAQATTGLFLMAAAAVCAVPGARMLITAAALATPAPREAAILWLIAREFWQLMAVAAIVVAIADIAVQRLRLRVALRMTPREVRDERAQHEGKPEAKSRRRAITIRRAKGLRLRAIAHATAVITNPKHVAVALRYAPPEIDVPVVVSRGTDLAASLVRAAAGFYGVPLVESPELARTIYQRVDVDDPIPEECYAAVAAIFAWLIRTHGRLRSGEES